MKIIKLTRNKFAIVDDADYAWLSQWKWYARKGYKGLAYYVGRGSRFSKDKCIIVRMHRQIMGLEYGDPRQVDHINHNGLDNRRSNLRICTHQQNSFNQRGSQKTSEYKGVYFHKAHKKWVAGIKYDGKRIPLGDFNTEVDAALAYDEAAKEYFGEFACLNQT